MNAKTNKLEAIPTSAQVLREAIARREACSAEMTRIEEKLHFITPIQAEEAAAQAALRAVVQQDADALQKWVDEGARGSAPEPNQKAREDAAHKLSQVSAKLAAAGMVKGQLEAEHAAAHERRQEANAAVLAAETQVMRAEYLRSAQALHNAWRAHLEAEAYFNAAKGAMFATNGPVAGTLNDQIAEITRPLDLTEGRALAADVYQRAQQQFAALRAGQEVAK